MADERHTLSLPTQEKPSVSPPTIPSPGTNDHRGFLGDADDSTETLRRVLDRLRIA